MQPLLSALRIAASGALGWVREYWQQGLCPVCGSATRVGYMRGEGRRQFLRCQVCGMEWVFPRARCPYCGADSPGDVVFYRPLESRQWLRLYRCRRCGAYWKIVDEEDEAAAERGLPPRELYDTYTFVLDAVAEMLASKRR
ncbi:MAG TPA: formate dehydrogenase accessory protein FdhE [Pyrodictium sp.]|nr:formate dehydrogenase accessory protein FdhE [Pyrodictium sp.]